MAEWLVTILSQDAPTLVGIDHGFSFPLRYFEVHGLEPDWPAFLDDFQRHWPTDEDRQKQRIIARDNSTIARPENEQHHYPERTGIASRVEQYCR